MATVVVMVGQCGCQLGARLFEMLAREHTGQRSSCLFHTDGFARCVGVDTEPKVVSSVLARDKERQGVLRAANFVYEQSGRGNNWAHGYCGGGGVDVGVKAVRVLDDEVLRSGTVDTLLFIHSLAGGTGSGLGSRLVELARK
eukprot:Hpha_TRINITY_DN15173_c2_g13::TRINITY_DN15173_c2_g13_i1::g.129177::m.129177